MQHDLPVKINLLFQRTIFPTLATSGLTNFNVKQSLGWPDDLRTLTLTLALLLNLVLNVIHLACQKVMWCLNFLMLGIHIFTVRYMCCHLCLEFKKETKVTIGLWEWDSSKELFPFAIGPFIYRVSIFSFLVHFNQGWSESYICRIFLYFPLGHPVLPSMTNSKRILVLLL